jgi:signal peptidase
MSRLPWSRKPPVDGPAAMPSRRISIAGRGWSLLSWFATIAVVLAMVGVIAFVTVPRVLGWQGVIVLSGSMEPALKTGGLAFVEPAEPTDVKINDVITYRRENSKTLITHRVIDIQTGAEGLEFTTRGDANADPDILNVRETQLVGVVHYFVPGVGDVIHPLHDRTNYYVFIGIPAALLILNEAWSIAAELRKARKNREAGGAHSMEGAVS